MKAARVRAIRGAIQVAANTSEEIARGVQKLLAEIVRANSLEHADLVSVLFTSTVDLNAAFPAAFARDAGLTDIPLICAVEIDVPGALERVIRVMIHCYSELDSAEISHIYLDGAQVLRSDLTQKP